MKRLIIFLIIINILSACKIVYYGPYPASVEYVYYGHHPIPSYAGGGMCAIGGRHIHNYPPEDNYSYYYYEGTYFYIGQTVYYFGPHPIPSNFGGGICLIEGYHSHDYYPHKSGYVYYPDDNVFVYVDVDINIPNRQPYEPKNKHGAYSSGLPFSTEGGRHEYHPKPDNSNTSGTSSGSHSYSGGSTGGESSSKGSSTDSQYPKPYLNKPDFTYTPEKYEPSSPHINTPSQTEKKTKFEDKPVIETPKDTNKRTDFDNKPTINTPDDLNKKPKQETPKINTPDETNKKYDPYNTPDFSPPSQTNKRVRPYQPSIDTPSQVNKKIETPQQPTINTPSDRKDKPDSNNEPKKFNTPSTNKITPYNSDKMRDRKPIDIPRIETKSDKSTDSNKESEEDDRIKKKVYQKDQIKIPNVNKRIPSPDPVSK